MKHIKEVDSLSLLAHKVAANVFDLSSEQTNVSIRDQIVRAQHLVNDLRNADRSASSILIIGMGVAGMTAALAACECGYGTVYVMDIAPRPFDMFHQVASRFVGPYMYEWPSPFHERQSYPSHYSTPWSTYGHSPLEWEAPEPISAAELAERMDQGLRKWWKAADTTSPKISKPHLLINVDKAQVKQFVVDFAEREKLRALQMADGKRPVPKLRIVDLSAEFFKHRPVSQPRGKNTVLPVAFEPDYVILAAGMGKEMLEIPYVPATPRFWADDTLKSQQVADQHVVVLGGGDGAIQDALRALTTHHHPSSFIDYLESMPVVRQALENEKPTLLSADRQLRQHSSWSHNGSGFRMADEACAQAARNLASNAAVKERVRGALRVGTGEVRLYVRGRSLDKAYMLNRFVIHLLAACTNSGRNANGGGMGFTLKFGTEVMRGFRAKPGGAKLSLLLHTPSRPSKKVSLLLQLHERFTKRASLLKEVDRVVVRFGIDRKSIPGLQLIQLNPNDKMYRERTTLKRVELPFVAMK